MADRPSEFALIAGLFAPLATSSGAFGLKDDAAVLEARPDFDLVVTTDSLVEGVHFLGDDPASTVARKALRVNLSDLAAKGAVPAGYLLALSLPPRIDMTWLEAFTAGLALDQEEFAVPLLGGDTTATTGPLILTITALGHVPAGRMVRRSGAKVGDSVFVSGTIGDSGGGLAVLRGETGDSQNHALVERYRVPTPRLALGRALCGIASAAVDVSDGLMADLGHVAEASQVRIIIEAERIPRSPALRAAWGDGPEAIVRAATSGDDYEIAFTTAEETVPLKGDVSVTRIGRVEQGGGIALVDAAMRDIPVPRGGFTHF